MVGSLRTVSGGLTFFLAAQRWTNHPRRVLQLKFELTPTKYSASVSLILSLELVRWQLGSTGCPFFVHSVLTQTGDYHRRLTTLLGPPGSGGEHERGIRLAEVLRRGSTSNRL